MQRTQDQAKGNLTQRSAADEKIQSIKLLFALRLPPYIVLAAIWEIVEHGPAVIQKIIR